eukprot:TRINITY_DN39654_c0_g1_i1.p1 TRINITY_DN39654_c0_g1~~TRINITY_DN39654_c0_g1_i1.p1  ORF type:complete len:252 (+),score=88.86 TRINITY_DN39654_c0_g1_i1:55-756(+)
MGRSVRATIVSDVVCPWCYLGQARLRAAAKAAEADGVEVEVRWLPWVLAPRARQVPRRLAYIARCGGDEGRAESMMRGWKRMFEAEGMPYADGGETGPSVDAHRLARWARERGGPALEDRVQQSLFDMYFARGKAPCDRAALADAAARAGLPAADAAEFLASGRLGDAVQAELRAAERMVEEFGAGSGVPFILLEDEATGVRQIIPGAQDSGVFAAVFKRLLRKAMAAEASKL